MEVVLAVGIVAFAFVGILGLLPAGMTQFRFAMDESVSSEIAHRVIGDARQMDFDTLIDSSELPGADSSGSYFAFRAPRVANPEFRYFDERGGEVIPLSTAARANPESLSPDEQQRVVYHVLVRVIPRTRIPTVADGDAGGHDVATVTVQVAKNPSNRELDIAPGGAGDSAASRMLFAPKPGVSILTYSAQIARNQ